MSKPLYSTATQLAVVAVPLNVTTTLSVPLTPVMFLA